MIDVSQAQKRLIDSVACRQATETIAIADALGRVASEDIASSILIPPCDNSAMDGFAIRSSDLDNLEPPLTLPVSQRIPAGAQPLSLIHI